MRDIANLQLVCQNFRWLTYLHKTVNKFSKFSKKIFKIEILTQLKSFLKEFVEELKLHFDFSELIYFNYYLSFFDSFDLDQFLLHLLFCPRSEIIFNDCYFCSMILIDGTEASAEFFNSAEHYFGLIFASSVFSPDLLDKFISQKNDLFRCNIFYESESKYQIIKSCKEKCMKFVVIANPTDLIISYFEVFVCFFSNCFHKMLEDCSLLSNKQAGDIDKREILLNLFISNFKKLCREVLFQSLCYEKFEEMFTILLRDVD